MHDSSWTFEAGEHADEDTESVLETWDVDVVDPVADNGRYGLAALEDGDDVVACPSELDESVKLQLQLLLIQQGVVFDQHEWVYPMEVSVAILVFHDA